MTKYHWLVRTHYRVRTFACATEFLVIGMHMDGHGYNSVAWGLLALQFLIYPHLVFWRAKKSRDPLKAELDNLLLDALISGVWAAALGFPVWIAFTLFVGSSLNNAINRGWRGALAALLVFASGTLAWGLVAGLRLSPNTDLPVTLLCLLGMSVYLLSVGDIVYAKASKLRETREALRKSEENYRLITENAGDLIAMLDAEGRWVYTSPSYRRLLTETALAGGVSAIDQVHPEDRDGMHAQIKNALETGELQEFLYRLMADDGSAKEFEATVNSFTQAGERKIVMVSIDITELRQLDKTLAIQAHAFENMTEGMMITAADGMILSVNRAFTTVTGYSKEDVVGKSESEFRIALQPPKFYEDIRDVLAKHGYWTDITWSRRKDKEIYRERRSVSSIRDEAGRTTHYITFFAIAGDGKN
ncbi:MAG: PAS domain S-box protein [Proteobacteria bacterium]|nr:PAS domain S-box protein [Pseudomonadota bacterium]